MCLCIFFPLFSQQQDKHCPGEVLEDMFYDLVDDVCLYALSFLDAESIVLLHAAGNAGALKEMLQRLEIESFVWEKKKHLLLVKIVRFGIRVNHFECDLRLGDLGAKGIRAKSLKVSTNGEFFFAHNFYAICDSCQGVSAVNLVIAKTTRYFVEGPKVVVQNRKTFDSVRFFRMNTDLSDYSYFMQILGECFPNVTDVEIDTGYKQYWYRYVRPFACPNVERVRLMGKDKWGEDHLQKIKRSYPNAQIFN